jgi:hypothetical protein
MFRFTIRDVLWLTVVVGLAVGWWLDHRFLTDDAAETRQARERISVMMYRQATAGTAKEWEEFIEQEWTKIQDARLAERLGRQ